MNRENIQAPINDKDRDRHYEDFMQTKPIEEGGVIRMSGKFLLDHEDRDREFDQT